MNNLDNINIEDMIYEIRGLQVMLDSDLAKLYHCKNGTKDINKAVKRNIERFPNDFYFQLTNEEYENLKFQIGTSSLNIHGGVRKLPYVFTEQGVAMLASVLHTEIAVETSVKIMRGFVKMRKYFASNSNILLNHENRLLVLEETFDKFKKEELDKILFQGQFYDAYSIFLDILNSSIEEIIIIDNYASKELLDILKNINRNIIIVSKNKDEILKKKYESQYKNVSFIYNDSFHDRFIILDRKILYTSGSSFKDIGKKCFGIHEINNTEYLLKILEEIKIKY